jgi:hypothetical protein
MTIEVTRDEHRVLIELVERRIEEMQPEIRRCRSFPYHEGLKEELGNLRRLLSRLQSSDVVTSGT